MNIKKIIQEIKEELDLIYRFREKILYPASPLDQFNVSENEKKSNDRA